MDNFFIALFLLGITILNIIVPLPGSSIVTPILALWINNPLHAIALVSIYFFLSGVIRAIMFREFIIKKYVKQFLISSIIFSVLGALAIIKISPIALYGFILLFVLWSLVKIIRKTFLGKNLKPQGKFSAQFVAVTSAFLQGTGLSGSDMRNSFFYADGLSIQETQATGSLISIFIFGAATITRFSTNQLSLNDLWFIAYALPILILGTWLGKKIIIKIPKKTQNYLIIIIITGIIISIGLKLLKIL